MLPARFVHEFVSHYYPNVLLGMRERWISPQFITTNRTDADGYDEVKRMGKAVIDALGIGTSPTHMEWFFGPKGLKFSEIGCRPPGVDAWDVYCAANELDLYLEWGRTIVGRPPLQQPSRRYAAGHVALRPDGDGRIAGYSGVDEIYRDYGKWIFAAHLPPPGSATQPGRGRVQGERLDPHAPSRLRRTARHAAGRRRATARPRGLTVDPSCPIDVALATCAELPEPDHDARPLEEALASRGFPRGVARLGRSHA